MKPNSCASLFGREIPRRQFLSTALLGGSAAVLAATCWSPRTLAAGHTDALLLSCMDYRLVDETERYMTRRGLRNKYDHIVLAGAALGAITEKFPEWNKTFWDELGLAIDLHGIHQVLLLDHRDCGAYKQIFGEDLAKTPKKETKVHTTQLQKLRDMIKEKYPKLEVETLLMNLAGRVESV